MAKLSKKLKKGLEAAIFSAALATSPVAFGFFTPSGINQENQEKYNKRQELVGRVENYEDSTCVDFGFGNNYVANLLTAPARFIVEGLAYLTGGENITVKHSLGNETISGGKSPLTGSSDKYSLGNETISKECLGKNLKRDAIYTAVAVGAGVAVAFSSGGGGASASNTGGSGGGIIINCGSGGGI